MLEEAFKTGRLLLDGTPSTDQAVTLPDMMPVSALVLAVVFIFLFLALLKRFLQLLPLLADSLFRARGSSTLENSVRYGQDRTLMALILPIPAVLVAFRYRLYNPSFLHIMNPDLRLAGVAAALCGYFILRFVLYVLFKPRHKSDNYRMAYYAGHTFFILLMLLVLITVGVLSLIKATDLTVSWFIYIEVIVVYLFFLFRKAQILSLSCNPLRTFLYLCGLEILPTALLVVSALVL